MRILLNRCVHKYEDTFKQMFHKYEGTLNRCVHKYRDTSLQPWSLIQGLLCTTFPEL